MHVNTQHAARRDRAAQTHGEQTHPVTTARDHRTHDHRAIDDLDTAIVKLSATINAVNYDLLVLIREFDERAGWMKWGLTSCREWLRWRCDLSESAAREKIRVAHALKTLPAISEAFGNGRLSYSKVRALTRVAGPGDEQELLVMAQKMTAAHVEQHCQQRRNATRESTADANRAHGRRSLRTWRDAEKGTVTITIELPIEQGALVERALDEAAVSLRTATDAPGDESSWSARRADAAVMMAKHYLAGDSATTDSAHQSSADLYQVMIHVDREALTGHRGASQLPVESVKRLCCDASIVAIVEDGAGEPLNIGRKQRTITTAIRRALWSRDKGCAYPGCTHTRFIDAHHIRHWANGGETSMANLLLLCDLHHRLVHEGGYVVRKDEFGKPYFKRPDGRAVPRCGYQVDDWRDAEERCAERASASAESVRVREAWGAYRVAC